MGTGTGMVGGISAAVVAGEARSASSALGLNPCSNDGTAALPLLGRRGQFRHVDRSCSFPQIHLRTVELVSKWCLLTPYVPRNTISPSAYTGRVTG
jgi:hypothetical protein